MTNLFNLPAFNWNAKRLIIYIICFVGIICVGIFFRFWNLASIGLGGDEGVYAGQALLLSGEHELSKYFVLVSRGTTNFMFHQTLQSLVFQFLGFSEFSARLVSAISSVLTVGLTFLIARNLFNNWIGLLSAFFIAIHGYSIISGRVNLLDSTMTFLFTLSMFFLAKWINSGQEKWAYFLAISTGFAVMTKIPSFLIIPIALLTIIMCKKFKTIIKFRLVLGFLLIFFISLTPAYIQILDNKETFIAFFREGSSRIINTPITFYLDKLISYGGILFVISVAAGIVISLKFRTHGDILCLIWLIVVSAFFQYSSIKGWNYLLPILPAIAILSARGFGYGLSFLLKLATSAETRSLIFSNIIRGSLGVLTLFFLIWTTQSTIQASLEHIVNDRPFAGLNEAAYWLNERIPDGSGIMTISHGSAQYLFGLYAKIDAYPFGSFRLHTLLPDGSTIPGPPDPDLLVQNGLVKYFVYYTSNSDQGDDPYHALDKTPTERRFLNFIQKYQGQIRHVIYDEYFDIYGNNVSKPRVWIFEIGKLLPEPKINLVMENERRLTITGSGFLINSHVNIFYNRQYLIQIDTDSRGEFKSTIEIPNDQPCGKDLAIFDEAGNEKSSTIRCIL